jgi:hypothetical protein
MVSEYLTDFLEKISAFISAFLLRFQKLVCKKLIYIFVVSKHLWLIASIDKGQHDNS